MSEQPVKNYPASDKVIFGTGGVDDLMVIQDYGALAKIGTGNSMRLAASGAFELHAGIVLPNGTEVQVASWLASTPPQLANLKKFVSGLTVAASNPRFKKLFNAIQLIPRGSGGAEPSGVPRLRLVQDLADQAGGVRAILELRVKILITGDISKVRAAFDANVGTPVNALPVLMANWTLSSDADQASLMTLLNCIYA